MGLFKKKKFRDLTEQLPDIEPKIEETNTLSEEKQEFKDLLLEISEHLTKTAEWVTEKAKEIE